MRVEGVARGHARDRGDRGSPGPAPQDAELVLAIVQRHAASLLRLARRHSLCGDDAHDAYQRAMEILLRRIDTLQRDSIASWMRTVVKHEAMAVRAARQAIVAREEIDLDARAGEGEHELEERVDSFDRLTRAGEALERLKPQEVRALLLKAEGHSYREICAITGWTYTKVNRCLTEGRKRFLERFEGIESGAECERWAPLLCAVADGEASARQLVEIRPHLRRCPACRATIRDYHATPRRIAAVAPVLGFAHDRSAHGLGARVIHLLGAGRERVMTVLGRGGGDSTGEVIAGTAVAGGGATAKLVAAACVAGTAASGLCVGTGLVPLASSAPEPRPRPAALTPEHHRTRAPRPVVPVSEPRPRRASPDVVSTPSRRPAAASPVPAGGSASSPTAPVASPPPRPAPSPPAGDFGFEGSGASAAGVRRSATRSRGRAAPAPRTSPAGGGTESGEFAP